MDRSIAELNEFVASQYAFYQQFMQSVSELPKLTADLQNIVNTIGVIGCQSPRNTTCRLPVCGFLDNISDLCLSVEKSLEALEDHLEWEELRNNQHAHNYQLLEYRRRR